MFEILGLLDDDLISEAEDDRPTHKYDSRAWKKWAAIAACAVLVMASGIWYLISRNILTPGAGSGGSSHGDSSTFMHYAGPIMPLNVIGNTDGITTVRETYFDFSAYETEQKDLWVTDNYILTNNTAENKTLKISYPFISSIINSKKFIPTLKINGNKLQTDLLIGDYTGRFTGVREKDGTTLNLDYIDSWEGYKALLESGEYFEMAQSKKTLADQKVIVYTFHDVTYPKEYDAATLTLEFDLPDGSRVITNGMNGADYSLNSAHHRHHRYSYSVSDNEGQRVVILGDLPTKYTVAGYENGACKRKIKEITGTVKTETMLLSEVIRECMVEHMTKYGNPDAISPLVTEQHLYRAVISMLQYTALGNEPKDRYDWMRLDDLIGESYSMERVMYLTAEVTIPAGESIKLNSRFIKDASYDFACAKMKENKGVHGYDMMTRLGSSLKFIEQKASINLPQTYKIIRQNFGFDIEKGITSVSLDMKQERYYLEIKKVVKNDK